MLEIYVEQQNATNPTLLTALRKVLVSRTVFISKFSFSTCLLKIEKEKSHLSIIIAMTANQSLHILGKLTLVAKLQRTQLIKQVLQLKKSFPLILNATFFHAISAQVHFSHYKISSTDDVCRKAINSLTYYPC